MKKVAPLALLTLVVLLAACGSGGIPDPNAPTAVMQALSSLPQSSAFTVVVPAGLAPGGGLLEDTEPGESEEIPIPSHPSRVDVADLPAIAGPLWLGLKDASLLPWSLRGHWALLRELPGQQRIIAGEPIAVALVEGDPEARGRLWVTASGEDLELYWLTEVGPEERMFWRIAPSTGAPRLEVWRTIPGSLREYHLIDLAAGEMVFAQLQSADSPGLPSGLVVRWQMVDGVLSSRSRNLPGVADRVETVAVIWADAAAGGSALITHSGFDEQVYAGQLGLIEQSFGLMLGAEEPAWMHGADETHYGRLFHTVTRRPLKGLQVADPETSVWQLPDGSYYLETAASGAADEGRFDEGSDTPFDALYPSPFAAATGGSVAWVPQAWGPVPTGLIEHSEVARVKSELLRLSQEALSDPDLDPETPFVGAPDLMTMPEFDRLKLP